MLKDKLDKLTKFAQEAYERGPWECSPNSNNYLRIKGGPTYKTIYVDPFSQLSGKTLEFVAAFDPDTALKLVQAVRILTKALSGEHEPCNYLACGMFCNKCGYHSSALSEVEKLLENI